MILICLAAITPQWENIARTHAQHKRYYYSFRSIVKRHVRFEFDWMSIVGIIFLLGILVTYQLVT